LAEARNTSTNNDDKVDDADTDHLKITHNS